MTKIKKFGIELEGEFSENLSDKMEQRFDWQIKGDGSIDKCNCWECENLSALEAISKPIDYTPTNINKIKRLFDFLQVEYKNGDFHFNKTCGLHFHFSFTPQKPPELWSVEFADYLSKCIATKHPKAYKERKDNHYCRFQLTQQEIADNHFGDRYRFLNLLPAFSRHKTLEIRAFPSDEPKVMKKYFLTTLDAINGFLTLANKEGILNKKFSFIDESESTPFTIDESAEKSNADNDNFELKIVL